MNARRIVVLTFITACMTDGDSPAHRETLHQKYPVQYMFKPSVSERVRIDALLDILAQRNAVVHLVRGGEVYRFGSGDRYLIGAFTDIGEGASAPQLFVVTGEPSAPEISTGFDPFSPEEPRQDSFTIQQVLDVDTDGLPDVVYCVWTESHRTGVRRAAGYTAGQWYQIDDSGLRTDPC